jgi:hypothetical protein
VSGTSIWTVSPSDFREPQSTSTTAPPVQHKLTELCALIAPCLIGGSVVDKAPTVWFPFTPQKANKWIRLFKLFNQLYTFNIQYIYGYLRKKYQKGVLGGHGE